MNNRRNLGQNPLKRSAAVKFMSKDGNLDLYSPRVGSSVANIEEVKELAQHTTKRIEEVKKKETKIENFERKFANNNIIDNDDADSMFKQSVRYEYDFSEVALLF